MLNWGKLQPSTILTKQMSSPALVVPSSPAPLPPPTSSVNVLPLSPPKPFPVAPFTATKPIFTTISTIAKVNSPPTITHKHIQHTPISSYKNSCCLYRQIDRYPHRIHQTPQKFCKQKKTQQKINQITQPPSQSTMDKLLEHAFFFSQTFEYFMQTVTCT